MAKSYDEELKAIEADERKLGDRRKALAERQRKQLVKALEKSELAKLDGDRLESLMKRMKTLGMDEVERRLAA